MTSRGWKPPRRPEQQTPRPVGRKAGESQMSGWLGKVVLRSAVLMTSWMLQLACSTTVGASATGGCRKCVQAAATHRG